VSAASGRDIEDDIELVEASHRALDASLADLDDTAARRPTRLPRWSVGHVLAHIARNADSFVRVLDAAGEGRVGVQYPGGTASRDADIESGSGRPADALRADVAQASRRLESALRATAADTWATGRALRSGIEVPVHQLPLRRLQEVEIHRVDLGLGYEASDWDERYVTRQLELLLPALGSRLAPGMAVDLRVVGRPPESHGAGDDRRTVSGSSRAILCWLVGRSDDDGLPPLGPW